MSTTEKQAESNRQNAQKSTGPTSEEGKASSSKNAVKHGFYSNDTVITSVHLTEDQAEYDLLLQSLIAELNPQSAFQECLVQRIANCLWRSRRAVIAETAHINRELSNADRQYYYEARMNEPDPLQRRAGLNYKSPEDSADTFTHLVNFKMMPSEQFAQHLLRYELRLDRQLQRAYLLLRRLKKNPADDPSVRPPNKKGDS